MKKNILVFSRDPGGAKAVIPLVEPLIKKGYLVELFGKDTALKEYRKSGLSARDIMRFISTVDQENITRFEMSRNYDFIITGTSADDCTEKLLWRCAESLEIPSFAILDQWVNYGIRFSRFSVSEIKEYNKNKNLEYLPTKILVMDKYAKNEAVQEGLSPSKILITGQPYFETLIKNKKIITQNKINKIKKNFMIKDGLIIVFASEPISDTYQESDCSEHYWGYTEKTIFIELLKAIRSVYDNCGRRVNIILKLHPKENRKKYLDLVSRRKSKNIQIIIDKDSDSCDVISIADIVCGMSSMFLIESVILDKPVISIQIGLKRKNPFVLDRRGIIKSVLNRRCLMRELISFSTKNKSVKYNFDFIKNPIHNVIHEMEKYPC